MPKPFAPNLGRRTPAEDLWLARRAAGKTSYEAASLVGVGRGRYRDAELGRNPARIASFRAMLPKYEPTLALLLVLARRRSGLGFARTAEVLSISRATLSAAERRGDPNLVRFWRKRGFRFPAGIA